MFPAFQDLRNTIKKGNKFVFENRQARSTVAEVFFYKKPIPEYKIVH